MKERVTGVWKDTIERYDGIKRNEAMKEIKKNKYGIVEDNEG